MGALSPPSAAAGYRPDIEGLRAVAIVLVVLAHAPLPGFAGGFVGVDAFFVVSGYLITRLLAHPSRPTLVAFYAARLRRLLPALLLVFVATCGAAALLLAPLEQAAQADLAAAVPLWLGNVALAARGIDYFGPQAETQVFQHTWSLAVEEQFYLAWPWLVLLALGVGVSGRREPASRARAVAWLATIGVCGFALGCLWLARDPVGAYYLLPARFWQFALGGVVALRFDPVLGARAPARRVADACGLAGGLGLLACALGFDDATPYPGWRAALPSLATAALLFAGTVADGRVARAFAAPPLQWLGRLSYGWYLWHWPVLLLGRTLLPAPGWPAGLALSLLALLLAWLSFHALESPLRHSEWLRRRPRATLALAALAMAGGTWLALGWQTAAERWQAAPDQRRFLAAQVDQSPVYRADCDDFHRALRDPPCRFGPADAPRVALLIGDSVGVQWFPAVARAFPAPHWRIVVLTRSSCPMVDVVYSARSAAASVDCARWRAAALQRVAAEKPDVVLVGSASTYGIAPSSLVAGQRRVLRQLARSTASTYLLQPTPVHGADPLACIARQAWRPSWLRAASACRWPSTDQGGRARHRAALRAAAAGVSGVRVVDLDPLACPDGECRAERDGTIVFRDRVHVGATFVAAHADEFAARLAMARAQ